MNITPTDVMKEESLCYTTRYVVFKLKSKYPVLGTKSKDVSNNEGDYKWIETVSNGAL